MSASLTTPAAAQSSSFPKLDPARAAAERERAAAREAYLKAEAERERQAAEARKAAQVGSSCISESFTFSNLISDYVGQQEREAERER